MSGFLLDELAFCSSSGNNDFSNYCEIECVSSNNPFWNAISINYAKKATGQVLIILNGSRTDGAVSNRSTFYRYELQNFNFTQIKQVKVLLLYSHGTPKYETCNSPKTLDLIKNFVESKKSTFICEEDNFYVNHVYCSQNPSATECKQYFTVLNKSNKISHANKIIILFFIVEFFVLI